MPNWCENQLVIEADSNNKKAIEDMERLKSLLDETLQHYEDGNAHGLLGAIISMPEELEDTIKGRSPEKPNGDNPNWYDWCWNNWGTKWDVDCDFTLINPFRMEFDFNSAWAPPIPWLKQVGSLFPNLFLCLTYHEPGMCFKGCASGIGEIVDNYEEYA